MFRLTNRLSRSTKYAINMPIKRLSIMPSNTPITHIKLNQLPQRYTSNSTKEKWVSTDKLYDMHRPATDKLITQQELELELLKKDYELLQRQYKIIHKKCIDRGMLIIIMTFTAIVFLLFK